MQQEAGVVKPNAVARLRCCCCCGGAPRGVYCCGTTAAAPASTALQLACGQLRTKRQQCLTSLQWECRCGWQQPEPGLPACRPHHARHRHRRRRHVRSSRGPWPCHHHRRRRLRELPPLKQQPCRRQGQDQKQDRPRQGAGSRSCRPCRGCRVASAWRQKRCLGRNRRHPSLPTWQAQHQLRQLAPLTERCRRSPWSGQGVRACCRRRRRCCPSWRPGRVAGVPRVQRPHLPGPKRQEQRAAAWAQIGRAHV